MTALDKLETAASCITGLVVLGFLTTYDSKAEGTDEYRAMVKRFALGLLGLPAHVAMIAIRIPVGIGAFILRPTSERIRQYSIWRMHKGAHRVMAY